MVARVIGGRRVEGARATLPVYNPATGEVIEEVPLGTAAEVDRAVQPGATALEDWSRTPVLERARLMFRFKELLERHFEDLARLVTMHHGKTLEEAHGEVRRGSRWWTSPAARRRCCKGGPCGK